jgi:hypothetical protein
MGLDFLQVYGANRVSNEVPQQLMIGDGDEEADERVEHSYEMAADSWEPRDTSDPVTVADWPFRPIRFVDGKDVGRTVAWLCSPIEGYPVPVRLAEIGAVVLRDVNRELRREWETVERVVALMVDLFPWDEIENFAIALQENGFRLLPCSAPQQGSNSDGGYSYEFERMRKTTANRSMDEMTRLETQALAQGSDVPTIVDGRLEPRVGGFNRATAPVVGLIKTHRESYLHNRGWQVFYDLRPGQRTPAFLLQGRNLTVVTWYLRLDGARGEMPNTGIVRVEVPQDYFEEIVGGNVAHLDRLSRIVCDYRCRDQAYGRAAISLYPIQRAEEKLAAIFTPRETLIRRFYRLTDL